MNRITAEMKPAMEGIVPSFIVTCSEDGMPNISYISQVFYVDDQHVAISHQFFNKSVKNFLKNPQVCVCIVNPDDGFMWKLDLHHSHGETEGPLFSKMNAQLEAIATMTGMEDVFKLKAAEIFTVLSIEQVGSPD